MQPMLGGCFRVNAVKAVPTSVARRRKKSQAIKNPKEVNFAWGFSVLVVPGTEPNRLLYVAWLLDLLGSLVWRCPQKCPQNEKCPPFWLQWLVSPWRFRGLLRPAVR